MKKLLPALFMALPLAACNEADPKDCGFAVCSDQFNTVSVNVLYTDNLPVALDTFALVSLPDKEPIPLTLSEEELAAMRATGCYFVIDDKAVAGNENTQRSIAFTGWLGSDTLQTTVTVNIDCCHVSPADGMPVIKVEKEAVEE
jgi:hypothetical protein